MSYTIEIERKNNIINNKKINDKVQRIEKIFGSNLDNFQYINCSLEDSEENMKKCNRKIDLNLHKNRNLFNNEYLLYKYLYNDTAYTEYIKREIISNGNKTLYIIDVSEEGKEIPKTIREYIDLAYYECPKCKNFHMEEIQDGKGKVICKECGYIASDDELRKLFN